MPYKEQKVEKLFYSIGEVADMFKVNTSLIRFWEKEFDIIKPKKNKKGNRLFTKEDIDNFSKRVNPKNLRLDEDEKNQSFYIIGKKDNIPEVRPVAHVEKIHIYKKPVT